MIPEINLAYIILDKSFNYWAIGAKSTRPMALELNEKINSVGLVKPPPGYFSNLNCDHVLILGADDYLFFYEILFRRGMSRIGNAEIGKLLVKTECEEITYDHIKGTLNCRVFTGNKNSVLNEVKFKLESSWLNTKKTKRVFTEEKRRWYNKYIPTLFFSSKNEIIQISIDEERHLLYTLSQKDYSEANEIAP